VTKRVNPPWLACNALVREDDYVIKGPSSRRRLGAARVPLHPHSHRIYDVGSLPSSLTATTHLPHTLPRPFFRSTHFLKELFGAELYIWVTDEERDERCRAPKQLPFGRYVPQPPLIPRVDVIDSYLSNFIKDATLRQQATEQLEAVARDNFVRTYCRVSNGSERAFA
jgi:hypothetical protein